ncbi:MAG: hypothetical protein JO223_09500 [Hyphomicrobiales bacterium]|nr:hypothetical protein [Hyphomicrobiales bacterium]MBV8439283.1 hypothetical protein [Hyphomicrobiales bacterium]
MKIATFRVGGERRVGLVDERRQSVAPFDVPVAEALLGVLAPAGVGIGFKPPKYVVPGDVVRIEISGIGVLENEFREARQ